MNSLCVCVCLASRFEIESLGNGQEVYVQIVGFRRNSGKRTKSNRQQPQKKTIVHTTPDACIQTQKSTKVLRLWSILNLLKFNWVGGIGEWKRAKSKSNILKIEGVMAIVNSIAVENLLRQENRYSF